jgi:hypothetical protein
MDLLTGGDLRFHIGKMRRFKESQTSKIFIKFYSLFFSNRVLCDVYNTGIRIFA